MSYYCSLASHSFDIAIKGEARVEEDAEPPKLLCRLYCLSFYYNRGGRADASPLLLLLSREVDKFRLLSVKSNTLIYTLL